MSRPRVLGLMLALITLLIYLPATRNRFVNYDDGDYVANNSVVRQGITWTGIQWAFTGSHASNWHPVTWLSHMLDCDLFQLNPAGHHLVNVLFHSANAALLFLLLFRLTGAVWLAFLVAALFAWHPLHVESVAWVAERKDVLSTFFALLALLSYAGHGCQKSQRNLWLACLFFALGLMSKPMLVTLPCVLLLLDYWPLQRFQAANISRLILEKWPFWLLSAGSCVVTYLAQRHEAVASLQKTPLILRLENMPVAYTEYLLKMIWPVNLAVFYPLPHEIAWQTWGLSLAILLAISAAVWMIRRQKPYCLMGWLWFLGTLVPVIGLIQVGDQSMADRYTYFPSIGIFVAVVFAIRDSLAGAPALRPVWVGLAILVLSACSALTEEQLGYWRTSETLFSHALAVTGDNALDHLNLGTALQADGKPDQAVAEYQKVIKLDPARFEVWNDIGKILYETGHPEDALPYCQQAIQLKPDRATLHNSLGLVLVKLNRLDEAMTEFSTAAKLDPDYPSPPFQMGQIFLKQGQYPQALDSFHKTLQLDPNNYPVLVYIARVLASGEIPQARDGSEALALAERANQMVSPPEIVGLDTLAMACAETGNFDQAIQFQQQALQLAGTNADPQDLAVLQERLQAYQNRQPWRETSSGNP